MILKPIVIDVSRLTKIEQQEAVNFLWVNGKQVWDYDRFRSWTEPKADLQWIEVR